MLQSVSSIVLRIALLATMVTSAACEEFSTPAELASPQILALSAESPAVAPGERIRLDALVAGPEGTVVNPDLRWTVEPATIGAAPVGAIEVDDDGSSYYRAPAAVAEEPTFTAVRATVSADDRELVAIKALGITVLPFENPSVMALMAGEQDLLASAPGETTALSVTGGQAIALEVDVAPAITDETTFAWYSTVGEIEDYQSNPTELVAPDSPGEGALFVVIRDGLGGVTWAEVPISVR